MASATQPFSLDSRAKSERVELLTLCEADQADWLEIASPTTLAFEHPLHVCKISFTPAIVEEEAKIAIQQGRFYCRCHGHDKGSPLDWANEILWNRIANNPQAMQCVMKEMEMRKGDVEFNVELPTDRYFFRVQAREYELSSMKVVLHATKASCALRHTTYTMSGGSEAREIVCSEALIGNKKVQLLFPDGPKSKQILLNFSPIPASQCQQNQEPEKHMIVSPGAAVVVDGPIPKTGS